MTDDIRWQQRLDNYQRALHQLSLAVELSRQRELSDLEKQGVIQVFEFVHELAWNVLKDYLESLLSGQNPNKINCLSSGGVSVL